MLHFTPVLSLLRRRVDTFHIDVDDAFGADRVRQLQRALAVVAEPTHIAIDSTLLDQVDGAALDLVHAAACRTIVVLAAPGDRAPALAVMACAQRWRRLGFRTALDGFGARRGDWAAVVSQLVDEVWLEPALTHFLPVAPQPARGLLIEVIQVLQHREVAVVAGGVNTPEQLCGAIELGLTGAFGTLLGQRHSEAQVRLRLAHSVLG